MGDPVRPESEEIARLEQRITALEGTVARLVAATGLRAQRMPPLRPAAPPPLAPEVVGSPSALNASPTMPAPAMPAPDARPIPRPAPRLAPMPRAEVDLEQWLGTRGLLAVGVIALLMSSGFFLKYAFERGWIAPSVRALGAVVAGIAVALAAERWIDKGLRRYGLALVGAGGGLVYLGIWAAAGPYALVGRATGILLVTVAAAVVAWRGAHHAAEPLTLWALLGAFLAPVLLPTPDARPEALLGYFALVAGAAITLASTRQWPVTLAAAYAGYLALAAGLVPDVLHTPVGYSYLTVGGVAALCIPRRDWTEIHLFAFALVWLLLIAQPLQPSPDGLDWARILASATLLFVACAVTLRTGSDERRLDLDIALGGYLVIAARLGPDVLQTPVGCGYLLAGGLVALWVPRPAWTELRLGGLGLAWLLMIARPLRLPPDAVDWARVLAASSLLLVTWWRHRGLPAFRVDELRQKLTEEDVAFLATPVLFALVAASGSGALVRDHPALPLAIAAVLYLATGWRRRWAPFVFLGGALAALAMGVEFEGAYRVAAWSAWFAIAVAADRWLGQRGAPLMALALVVVAGLSEMIGIALQGAPGGPAFHGTWSFALYVYLAAAAASGLWWRIQDGGPPWSRYGRAIAWSSVGVAALVGVTTELQLFFVQHRQVWQGADLAGDLSTSIWWLVYAAVLVGLGFWRALPTVRHAGLAVACLAAGKIALFDLSRLDALYRVASFFVLALIALAVAYAYNRRARQAGGDAARAAAP